MRDSVTIPAYAKINPVLDVTGRRPDGYHEVRMILQQIALHDEIRLARTRESGIRLRIIQNGPAEAPLTADETNLAYRAAALLTESCRIDAGVSITLIKAIPVAAGLAGGSADAAAVLCGMNELFELGLSDEVLCSYGLKLGADVPFCIRGGAQLAEGIGEQLTTLPALRSCPILLVKPPEGVSTGAVYRALDAVDNPPHPSVDAAIAAYEAGSLPALCTALGNILECVTLPMLPQLAEIKAFLLSSGAAGALMSGSGPTVFGVFADLPTAQAAVCSIEYAFPACRVILTALR